MSEAGSRPERRRAARRPAALEVEYRVVDKTGVDPVRDISSRGMFLSCASPLPLGTRVEVFLPLGEEEAPVRIAATVVRVVWGGRKQGRPASPGMALAFDPLSEAEEQRLACLLEEG